MIYRNGLLTLLLASATVQALHLQLNGSLEAPIEAAVSVNKLHNETNQSFDFDEIKYRPIDAQEVDRDAIAPSTVKQIHVVSLLSCSRYMW